MMAKLPRGLGISLMLALISLSSITSIPTSASQLVAERMPGIDTEGLRSFTISPDGTKIAFPLYGSRPFSVRVDDLTNFDRSQFQVGQLEPRWAQDTLKWFNDTSLLYADDSGVWLLDIRVQKYKQLNDIVSIEELDVSPDRTRIAFVEHGDRRSLKISNLDGSGKRTLVTAVEMELRLNEDSVFFTSPRWSPDGSRIAFTVKVLIQGPNANKLDRSTIWVVSPDGTNLSQFPNLSKEGVNNQRWSPDGEFLMFWETRGGGLEKGVSLLNLRTNKIYWLTTTDRTSFTEWFPNSKRIALSIDLPKASLVAPKIVPFDIPQVLNEARPDITVGKRIVRFAARVGDWALYEITRGEILGLPSGDKMKLTVTRIGIEPYEKFLAEQIGIDATEVMEVKVEVLHNGTRRSEYKAMSGHIAVPFFPILPDKVQYAEYLRQVSMKQLKAKSVNVSITEGELLYEYQPPIGPPYSYVIDPRTGIVKQIGWNIGGDINYWVHQMKLVDFSIQEPQPVLLEKSAKQPQTENLSLPVTLVLLVVALAILCIAAIVLVFRRKSIRPQHPEAAVRVSAFLKYLIQLHTRTGLNPVDLAEYGVASFLEVLTLGRLSDLNPRAASPPSRTLSLDSEKCQYRITATKQC